MARVRVLVVEDSPTVRRHLCELLDGDSEIEVVGEAANGREAVELCRSLRPDVITMDMMLPVMTGLAATEAIMAKQPTPILVVSASTNRAELFKTYDALAAGAVDVLEKPDGATDDTWQRAFLATVKLVARIPVITHPRPRIPRASTLTDPSALPRPVGRRAVEIVAIGASTGGPGAIVDVLHLLPDDLAVPVLVVLHITEPFGSAFADWLGSQTSRTVAFAADRQPLAGAAGKVVMAPPGAHLVVRGGRTWLTNGPERHSCRPSIDVLFESVAREYGPKAVGCLLTGMGRDGAAGLLELRAQGAWTIAQDEATSVVYGMPREAALLGAAEEILPLNAIGPAVGRLIKHGETPSHERDSPDPR